VSLGQTVGGNDGGEGIEEYWQLRGGMLYDSPNRIERG